jgi:hypothetical protein
LQIGMTLPCMVRGLDRKSILSWCRGIDDGPFVSLAVGERVTYHSTEMRTLLAAAAALTERVRIVPTLYILPMHPTALVAKEVASLDVLSNGRVTITVASAAANTTTAPPRSRSRAASAGSTSRSQSCGACGAAKCRSRAPSRSARRRCSRADRRSGRARSARSRCAARRHGPTA